MGNSNSTDLNECESSIDELIIKTETKYNKAEIQEIFEIYQKLKTPKTAKKVFEEIFLEKICIKIPTFAKEKLQKFFFSNCQKNFEAFVLALQKLDVFRQNEIEKNQMIFGIFDENDKSFLSKQQAKDFFEVSKNAFESTNVLSPIQKAKKIEKLKAFNTSLEFIFMKKNKQKSKAVTEELLFERGRKFSCFLFDELFAPFSFVASKSDLKRLILNVLYNHCVVCEGTKWDFVHKKWWNSWAAYVELTPTDLDQLEQNKPQPPAENTPDCLVSPTPFTQLAKHPTTDEAKNEKPFSVRTLDDPKNARNAIEKYYLLPLGICEKLAIFYGGEVPVGFRAVSFKKQVLVDLDEKIVRVWIFDSGCPKLVGNMQFSMFQTLGHLVDKLKKKSKILFSNKLVLWVKSAFSGGEEKNEWVRLVLPGESKSEATEERPDKVSKRLATRETVVKTLLGSNDIVVAGAKSVEHIKNKIKEVEKFFIDLKNWTAFECCGYIDVLLDNSEWKLAKITKHKNGKASIETLGRKKTTRMIELEKSQICDCEKPYCDCGGSVAAPFSHSRFPPEIAALNAGTRGLKNLGNTCYMNSAVQCLANTPLLCNYFLSGQYKKDLPCEAEDGIVEDFARVIEALWEDKSSPVSLLSLKNSLDKKTKKFLGYSQHDSHEFTAFLLDGMHEELKSERAHSISTNDESKITWNAHMAENNSFIAQLFHGQLRSELVCRHAGCGNRSSTFDPFMYLSLPIPRLELLDFAILFHPADGKPLKLSESFHKTDRVRDLAAYVSERLSDGGADYADCSARCVVAALTARRTLKAVLEQSAPLSGLDGKQLVVYEGSGAFLELSRVALGVGQNAAKSGSVGRAPLGGEENGEANGKERSAAKSVIVEKQSKVKGRFHIVTKSPQKGSKAPKTRAQAKSAFLVGNNSEKRGYFHFFSRKKSEKNEWNKIVKALKSEEVSTLRGTAGVFRKKGDFGLKKAENDKIIEFGQILHFSGDSFFGLPLIFPYCSKTTISSVRDFAFSAANRYAATSKSSAKAFEVLAVFDKEHIISLLKAPFNPDLLLKEEAETLCRSDSCGLSDLAVVINWEAKSKGTAQQRMEGLPEARKEEDSEAKGEEAKSDKGKRSVNGGYFSTLTNFLSTKTKNGKDREKRKKKSKKAVSLENCFELFTREETLSDGWKCPECGQTSKSTKKIDLWTLPSLLVIQLKRFDLMAKYYGGREQCKAKTKVDFPVSRLDLGRFCPRLEGEGIFYDLFAVANHFGGSCLSGHYTAFAKNPRDLKWRHFNDEKSAVVDSEAIKTANAYILYYCKRNK